METIKSDRTQDFETWMKKVNAIVSAQYGIDCDDLPDMCYLDMYEDGYSIKQAARAAIRNANGECEE